MGRNGYIKFAVYRILLLLLMFMLRYVWGHGRLTDPPSRSTMWRYGYDTPINYMDNQLFCGGYPVSKLVKCNFEIISTCHHYNDAIKSAMASQIASLTIVYSSIYSGADQRKHQSSASLAFVRGIHRWPVNPLHKGPGKCFHLMTSSCSGYFPTQLLIVS